MNPMIYAVAAGVVAVILWFVTRANTRGLNQPVVANERAQPVQGRPTGARRRRNVYSGIQQRAHDARDQDSGEDDEEEDLREGKIGAKKLRKLQEKEEKRKLREQELQRREERKKELAEQDEKRKLEDEKKLQEEERIEEEKKKEREEKERQEHEEYLKLKAMFSVDEEGHQVVDSGLEGQNMLMEFVEYIKRNKVVLLEDLASHFGLRTQDAIDRVQNMLEDEILSGVIDDRGKFIYISLDELNAVAKFVTKRGRVSISDLAQASNSLVNLISESATAKS